MVEQKKNVGLEGHKKVSLALLHSHKKVEKSCMYSKKYFYRDF